MSDEKLIIGLKMNVSKFVSISDRLEYKLSRTLIALCKAWTISKPSEDEVWDIVSDLGLVKMVADTKLHGVVSTIEEYETKAGKKSMVHKTYYKKYLGSVKTLGTKPVGYKGNLPINKRFFQYVHTETATCFEDFFQAPTE